MKTEIELDVEFYRFSENWNRTKI